MLTNQLQLQNKKIALALALFAALGGLTAFLIYLDKRKHKDVERQILHLDKNIKELQLAKLQEKK